MNSKDKVDVLIVGAGAASSVYAATLAEAGKSVLCLEQGPQWTEADLYSSSTWSRRLKWTSQHVIDGHKIQHNYNNGRGVGGAALHHAAIWPRYHEEDFKLQSLYGRGLDWPFEYSTLRPYYDKVQADVGISGDASKESWRPPGAPYPLPPVPIFAGGQAIKKGFDKLGIHTSPTPLAVLSEPYKGRSACIWDGWCESGCPIGALANPLVVYFPRALKAGAKVQANTYVTRVLTNARGDRATGVEYVGSTGEREVQHADVVVIAPNTVAASRLLLNSHNSKHPTGLGNGSGLLGRYLSTHTECIVFGLFEEETQPYAGVWGGSIFSQDSFAKDKQPSGAFGSRGWAGGVVAKPTDLAGIANTRPELIGSELDTYMHRASKHMAMMESLCEDQVREENRVVLDKKKDHYGMPRARVEFKSTQDGIQLYHDSIEEGRKVFEEAGASDIGSTPMGTHHPLGGTIMGNDPATSVTNRYCQVHEIDNLIVGSLSVVPTTSCVHSTYTLHALAMMSAEHLLEEWSGIAS